MSYSREFVAMTRDYERRLVGMAHSSVRQWEDAEDILQETYIKIFKAVKSVMVVRHRSAWLSQVLLNSVRDYRRRDKRLPQSISLDDQFVLAEAECALVSAAPEHELIEGELDADLALACRSLPDALITPLRLQALDELSYKEIAERMNLPIGTVMSRLSRAKKMMKCRLKSLSSAQ